VLAAAARGDLRLAALRAEWEAEREADEDPETFPNLDAWLTQRQLGAPVAGDWKPNAAAVLVFGDSPQDLLPGAFVELVRYAGDDVEADVAERKTITGNLPDQLETLWIQLKAHNAEIPSGTGGMREAFAPAYPDDALKELARNMIQHRLYEGTNAPSRVEWYDRRIEFSNPGGPYGRATEGQFGEHSDYRNPLITSKLAELGYVQRLGRGVRRVRLLLERNGNPPLEVETDGYTRVIVRRR
jgi:ATP-dependent DNA helicase RecG